ncbi:MAG: hypothetical protein FD163_1884 [Hyphomonadaceae bacterium]|nr:MAG: hypothetical protein FD163_1884 [Hyphomonadaceae bacterium]
MQVGQIKIVIFVLMAIVAITLGLWSGLNFDRMIAEINRKRPKDMQIPLYFNSKSLAEVEILYATHYPEGKLHIYSKRFKIAGIVWFATFLIYMFI